MKRLILFLILLISYGSTAFSQELRGSENVRGYRGFLDFGYGINLDITANRFELVTSHGYLFNSYFFAGMGTGLHFYFKNGDTMYAFPLYIDLRGNLSKGRIVPIIGFKAGYTVALYEGMLAVAGVYISPSAGAKLKIDHKKALSTSLAFTSQNGVKGLTISVGFEF